MDRELYRQQIIEWQDWRNEQYSELVHERRRIANLRKHTDIKVSAHNGNPERQASDVAGMDNDPSILNEMESEYDRIVWMDSRLKAAFNSTECNWNGKSYIGNTNDLPNLISEAEQMMK